MISRGRLIGWSFELDRIARVLAIARGKLGFTQASFATEAAKAGYHVRHWREHDFAAAHATLIPESPGESP